MVLLQVLASHEETKDALIKTKLLQFLYPFIDLFDTDRSIENLRLTALATISSFSMMRDPAIPNFLYESGAIPLHLRQMETGSTTCIAVACFNVRRCLEDPMTLNRICENIKLMKDIIHVLTNLLKETRNRQSYRLLKNIFFSYWFLSTNERAFDILKCVVPMHLWPDCEPYVSDDKELMNMLNMFAKKIEFASMPGS